MGTGLISSLTEFTDRVAWLHEHALVTPLGECTDAILVLRDLDNPSLAMSAFRQDLQREGYNIAASVTPDDRGSGYTLYRYADDPRIDFAKLAGRPEITFAHAGGFIAKTAEKGSRSDIEKLLIAALVAQ